MFYAAYFSHVETGTEVAMPTAVTSGVEEVVVEIEAPSTPAVARRYL